MSPWMLGKHSTNSATALPLGLAVNKTVSLESVGPFSGGCQMIFSQESIKTVGKHNYLQSYHSKITVMILWWGPQH